MIEIIKKIFGKKLYSISSTKAKGSTMYGGRGERELQLKLELSINVTKDQHNQLFKTAKALTQFNMVDQDRFLTTVENITHHDVAYALCVKGTIALRRMNINQWDQWVNQINQKLQSHGSQSAVDFIKGLEAYIKSITPPAKEVSLQQVYSSLEMFLTGLGGSDKKIIANQIAYTDTETIYLPEKCTLFDKYEDNFNFYKVLLTHLWLQIEYGTWRMDIATFLYEHPDPDKTINLYRILETLRLDECIAREFMGIHRLVQYFGSQASFLPDNKEWEKAYIRLKNKKATNQDSIALIPSLYSYPLPKVACYQGQFLPRQVNRAIKARSEINKQELQNALLNLLTQNTTATKEKDDPYTLKFYEQLTNAEPMRYVLMHQDEEIEIPEHIREILEQVIYDLGEIPKDYFTIRQSIDEHDSPNVQDVLAETDVIMKLPEWDYAMQRQRADWCHIILKPSELGDSAFAYNTRNKHRGITRKLNHTFEALREENRINKKQASGDEIDIDSVIEAQIDCRITHNEMDENIFTRINKNQRNVAVMFMVDTSSSTYGMVNTIERESLILLCDSLNLLGDSYAIYGFSSNTRKNCNLYHIKEFNEIYDDNVERRIAGISTNGYTRIGATIRYLSNHLIKIQAKTKLLILLSDGKPDDLDGYRGQYGIEDTRRALLETRATGIIPYCITIDKQAKDYLPYMYGQTNYSIISKVEELPFKMADIYRRITT